MWVPLSYLFCLKKVTTFVFWIRSYMVVTDYLAFGIIPAFALSAGTFGTQTQPGTPLRESMVWST